MSPQLSIVIATYNYADYLPAAIDSALNQETTVRYRVVVVDDGSTDDTARAMARYAGDERVAYIRQANAGQSVAFNNAIRASESELIMFLDADDLLLDGCIERTVAFLQSRERLGLVFSDYEIFSADGVLHPSGTGTFAGFRSIPHRHLGDDRWLFTGPLTPHILVHGSFMPTSSLTVKRRFLPPSGLFREGFQWGGETDFTARTAFYCESGYIDAVLSRKRDHPASMIHADERRVEFARCSLEISEAQREEFGQHPELAKILDRLIAGQAVNYAWGLLEQGRRKEARRLLRRYLPRYPRKLALHKLWARSLFGRRRRRTRRSSGSITENSR